MTTKKKILPADLTLQDIHFCLNCDAISENQIAADHTVSVGEAHIKELTDFGIKDEVAKDMLQHFVGTDGKPAADDPQNAFGEYFNHAYTHHKEGDW